VSFSFYYVSNWSQRPVIYFLPDLIITMIDTALILLRNELISFLSKKDSANVIVCNFGFLESPGGDSIADSIMITLVLWEKRFHW